MENSIKTVIGIGIAILCAGEAYSIWKAHKAAEDIQKFNKAIDDVSASMDVDIPDDVVWLAMERAANKEAEKTAKFIADKTTDIIQKSVDTEVDKQKDKIESSVREELERKISLIDIEDIKSRVVCKASASVIDNLSQRIPFVGPQQGSSDASSIIRACKEAGVTDPWEIKDILKAAKEVK